MTGARLTVWLTAQVGLLMVFSRRDKPGITVGPTGETFDDVRAAMSAAWAMAMPTPISDWRIMGSLER